MRLAKLGRPFCATAFALLIGSLVVPSNPASARALPVEVPSLDGTGNNVAHPDWGAVGSTYSRVAPARYGDGLSAMWNGPNPRYIGNRLFNDNGRHEDGQPFAANVFSEHQVSQWGWTWGQFINHTLSRARTPVVAAGGGGDPVDWAVIPLDPTDPLEARPSQSQVDFFRHVATPGTGVSTPREVQDMVGSYINAFNVYGGTNERLDWMREGSVDGNPANNSALLLMPNGYLPRRDARGDAASAPPMQGFLGNDPTPVVAGDVRANEQILLTGTQTLFAREHNRIVGLLPDSLSAEEKFQVARRIVIAEMQYITYNEFLPAMGVRLPDYAGYNPGINTTLSQEFATNAYRAHSMVHGDVVVKTAASRYSQAELDAFRDEGLTPTLSADGKTVTLTVPLDRASLNPALVSRLQLGPLLQGIGGKPQYRNDELVEDLLRNVIVPCQRGGGGVGTCVSDLSTIDLARGRDHGLPTYNELRRAYGLAPKISFKAITGESSERFPADPELTAGDEINDPDSLDFVRMTNLFGTDLDPDGEASLTDAVSFTRRTPLAARLKAIYGSVDDVEAFSGMVAEPHAPGSELGELQRAIWTREFQRLRDGDRFFYGNQASELNAIKNAYGIDFRKNLGDVIAANTDLARDELPRNVFFVGGQVPPAGCKITYRITDQQGRHSGAFTARVAITNTGRRPIDAWALRFRYLEGQVVTETQGGVATQKGTDVSVTNAPDTAGIPPGHNRKVDITATWTGRNPAPDKFTLNTTACS